ncbi:MAG: hypothetical protein ACK59J_03990, partial [Pseudanabaena sp.]
FLVFIFFSSPLTVKLKTKFVGGGASPRLTLFGFYVLTRMATAIPNHKSIAISCFGIRAYLL